MILRFSLDKHLLNTSSAHCTLAIQVPRESMDESEFTGWDYKVKECVLGTRTILNVISSTTKNKSTQKMINATSEPAVLQRCLGSAKDRAEGISQAPALMSPHCSNSVSGKNLQWMKEACSSPVCVGRSLCSSLKCGQDLSLLTLWWWQNTYGGCFACLASNDCESVGGLERGYPLWVITEISVCLRDCLLCQWANCRPLHV